MSDGLNGPPVRCKHGWLPGTCPMCREIATLERRIVELENALSSGICSAHRPPRPLDCDTCNMVTCLTGSVDEYITKCRELVDRLAKYEQPDDAEPVTEDWLRSIGAESLHPDEPWIGWADDWGHLLVWDAVQDTWSIRGDSIWEEHIPTRGQVRRLIAALRGEP